MWIGSGTQIQSGNVVVADISERPDDRTGPRLGQLAAKLVLGPRVSTPATSAVIADTIHLGRNALIEGNAHYNELSGDGTIMGHQTQGLELPVSDHWPSCETAAPGEEDVTVARGAVVELSPGAYRDLSIMPGGQLVLGGGSYYFRHLEARNRSSLRFTEPTMLGITGTLKTGKKVYVGPAGKDRPMASSIVIRANGDPRAVEFGPKNELHANVCTSERTLWLRQGTVARGAFFGGHVRLERDVRLTLDSASEDASARAGHNPKSLQ
jgi:hypothetical protein